MLNKFFINLIIFLLSIISSLSYANEPVDIWNIEKKNVDKVSTISNLEESKNNSKTVVTQDALISNIEEDEILKRMKIVGLYDPEENGFGLEMWNNTKPSKIFELSKKINNIDIMIFMKNLFNNF